MKRILPALVFALCFFAAPALAVCPSTLQLKDNAGVTPTAKFSDDGAGNCLPNVSVFQWGGTNLGAASNYGTSPGAVAVPGVNAFVTNIPAVTQSGTWTVQPGNTANTTAWLFSISQGGNTVSVPTAGADARTNATNSVFVTNFGMVYNGATWDRAPGTTTGALVNPGTPASWGIGGTGAATPANAHLMGMAQGGNLIGLTGTSGNLNVQCANCSGSGVSAVDQA